VKVIEDNPLEEWIRIDDYSPAIISKEEYDAAHRQMGCLNRSRQRAVA